MKIRKIYIAILVVIVAGAVLSAAGAFSIYHAQLHKMIDSFNALSSDRAELIENVIADNILALQSVGDFYRASVSIDKDEFRTFASGVFSRRPSVAQLRWLARVKADERGKFEESARASGMAGFEIVEPSGDGKGLVRAGDHEEYYPVYFFESYSGSAPASRVMGLDASSIPVRWEAMKRARDTGEPRAVREDIYYSTDGLATTGPMMRVFLPIYRNGAPQATVYERRENITGFVVLISDISIMIESSFHGLTAAGIDIYVYEESETGESRLLHYHPSRTRSGTPSGEGAAGGPGRPAAFSWSRELGVAGERWLIVSKPAPYFLATHRIWLPWAFLAIGLISTLALSGYLPYLTRRSEIVSRLVDEKTKELNESGDKLRRANREWSDTFDSISDFVFILDGESRIVKANRSFLEAMNLKAEDVIGKKCYETVHKSHSPWPGCPHQKTMADKEPHKAEVDDPGLGLPLYVTTSPISDSEGNITGSIHIAQDISERRRAEAALRESRERLTFALESSHTGAWDLNLSTREAERSPEHDKIFGYDRMLPRWTYGMFMEHVLPEDRLTVGTKFDYAVQNKRGWEFECRILRADKKVRWIWAIGRYWSDPAVSEPHLVGIVQDITARKESEEAIKASDERIRTVFEQAPLGIALIDSHTGRIYEVNQKYADIVGRSREGMTKIDWMSLTHPDDIKPDQDNMALMNAGKTSGFNMQKRYLRPDGSIVWVNMTIAPLNIAGNIHLRHLCMVEDITRRKKVEEALAASQASYRAIFDSANDAIMLRDIESLRIVDANKKAGEMFGCSREEMVTQAPEELFLDSGEYRFTKVRGYFEKARDGEPQLFEWLVRDKNGRMFWVEISMRKAAIGGSFRLLSIARDVTERRRLMEMKDDFMSMVSHELRTPLGIIKEGISLVLEGIAGDVTEKQKDVLGMAKSNTDRLARLIHQVLDFQKLNAGKMEFRFAEHDLNEIAGEVHRHSQALAAKKGLALELRADGNIPRIRFDRDRIVEVLMNLVNNAIKFTDKGGITISTCMKDGAVEVSVADSGCGVKPEDVPRLFQRFAQLERKPGGTGLGLAISKEIVETHRGRIWVESEYGKGATFRFMIPV